MIISGGSRANWRYFAKHLMKPENDRVFLAEIKGLFAENVRDAFREIDALGMGTQVVNRFYHADLNPREGERLTEAEWTQAVDTLERNLGLEGQPRFVVEHEKKGRIHRHVVWCRIDLDTMKAIPDSWDYKQHQRTSRELEQAFGLEPVNGVLGPDGKRVPRRPKNYETRKGKETGITPEAVAADLSALRQQCDTGQAFASALEEQGYILAKGDRRDFVVIDQAANEHSLPRRLGVKAAEVRNFMAGVDRDALPTVQAARELARSRRAERDKQDEAKQPDPASPPADPAKARDKAKHHMPALGVVAEELLHAAKDAIARRERAPSSPGIPKPEAMPQATPPMASEPSAFERLARKLTETVHSLGGGPTIAESVDPARQPAAPPPGPPGHAAPDPFGRLVTEALRDAKEAAPIAEELAVWVAAALEHHTSGPPGPEPSEFERATEARTEALKQAGGDALFITEGLAWTAGKITPASDPLPQGRERTPFERVTQDTSQALRENGGEPYMPGGESFWSRAVTRLRAANERAASWITERFETFAEWLRPGRSREPTASNTQSLASFAQRLLESRTHKPTDHERER